jgi:hypothetical protein
MKNGLESERIVREDQAVGRAAQLARPGDTVVVIVNDDSEQSVGFIKKSFDITKV